MIKRISQILEIDYSLKEGPHSTQIKEGQENGFHHGLALPFSFKYKGVWCISHQCRKCLEVIYFREYPKRNFTSLDRISSKRYKIEVLLNISKLFSGLKLIDSKPYGFVYITNDGFNGINVNALEIPIKKFICYSCPQCRLEYLCLFRQGHPMLPDRGSINGALGEIFIDEIISVHLENGETVEHFLNNNKQAKH